MAWSHLHSAPMALLIVDSPDLTQCERGLDANWNERKHLIEEEFDLRLKIQALLVRGDSGFEEVRGKERLCKSALQRNDDEYEALVVEWGAEVLSK